MNIFIVCLVLSGLLQQSKLPYLLSSFSSSLQEVCPKLLPESSQHKEFLSAFLCGKNLQSEDLKEIFIFTALYHLIVVSASHLIFLTTLLEFLFLGIPKSGILVFMTLFTLFTGFQPPVLRALFSFILDEVNQRQFLHWTKAQIILLSSICCLLVFPHWLNSYSLLLSTLASLALTLSSNRWLQAVFVYLCTVPVLLGWGQLNPISILINILLAPLLSGLLWLASFAAFISPATSNWILHALIWVLKKLSQQTTFFTAGQQVLPTYLWGYFILLFVLLHCLHIYEKRNRWHF